MMCEHEFEQFTVGKPTTWGLQALRFVDMCIFCGESRYEVNLRQQLAAANARVAKLTAERQRDALDGQAALDEANSQISTLRELREYDREKIEQANARVAELEDFKSDVLDNIIGATTAAHVTEHLAKLRITIYDERKAKEQAEAQCNLMQIAINRYVMGNIELLDELKAALEERK